jgi:hypothetical protein
MGLAGPVWFFSLLSFHFVNKIFVSFNSVFNILLYTVHTHLYKLKVSLTLHKHIKKSLVINKHIFPCRQKFFNSQLNSYNACVCEDFLNKV